MTTLVIAAGYADTTLVLRRLLPVLIIALAAMTGACAARAGVPRPFPGASLPPGATDDLAPPAVTAEAARPPASNAPLEGVPAAIDTLITTALGFRGVPYRNGGSDPSGFDCSGFVQYVFARVGAVLPREVREQFEVGRAIDRGEIQAGDLIFFQTVSRSASHVGLAIGNGQFVHAPSSRGVVRVERYDSSYWGPRFLGARRVTQPALNAGN